MTRILEQRDPDEVSDLQLAAHASDFVLAGSETTATAIGAMTYYLLRTPAVMAKLQQEIWEAFRSYDEICDKSTLGLPYLRAVILEGLRIYPPLPLGLPRIVPKGGDTVDGHFLPERVSSKKGDRKWKGADMRTDHRFNKPRRFESGPSQLQRPINFQTRKVDWSE